ncbi:hypothetical protein Tco_0167624 [Tanacetum coccineum]
MEGVMTEMPITTAKEKAQRRLEVKARTIRKTQRNLLKQKYENFTAPSSEMLDQNFDRLQKLVSQLEILDEKLSQEDVNQKLLRSLSPEWNTHAVKIKDNKEQGKLKKDWCPLETSTSTTLVSCDGLGGYDWSDQAEEGPKICIMAFSVFKYGLRKEVDDALSIEEWVSDDEEKDVSQSKTEKKTVRPSVVKKEFVKSKQQEKMLGKMLNKLSNIGKTLTVQETIKEIGTI